MDMKHAAIIGCGWLGQEMARALIRDGWQVTGTTTTPEKLGWLRQAGIEPLLYRIGDPDPPAADLVIISATPSRTADYVASLERTASGLPPTANLMFISTTSVYAARADVFPIESVIPGRPEPIDERTTSRHSPVPIAELIRAEGVFWGDRQHRSAILRCGALVGPGRDITRLYAGRPVPDAGKPANVSPSTLVTDRVLGLTRDGGWGVVDNAIVQPRPTRAEAYGSGRA
jgi:nucleoside-diphosphate-sugar epimerase